MSIKTREVSRSAGRRLISSSVNQQDISGATRYNKDGSAAAQIVGGTADPSHATSTKLQGAIPNTDRRRYITH